MINPMTSERLISFDPKYRIRKSLGIHDSLLISKVISIRAYREYES